MSHHIRQLKVFSPINITKFFSFVTFFCGKKVTKKSGPKTLPTAQVGIYNLPTASVGTSCFRDSSLLFSSAWWWQHKYFIVQFQDHNTSINSNED